MAVLEVNPAMAAKWRTESGEEMSLKTVAYEHGLVEGDSQIFDDLRAHSPAFVAQEQEQISAWEQKVMADMDAKAKELSTARESTLMSPASTNPALSGKFSKYFEGLNADAALEAKLKQQG